MYHSGWWARVPWPNRKERKESWVEWGVVKVYVQWRVYGVVGVVAWRGKGGRMDGIEHETEDKLMEMKRIDISRRAK